MLFRCPGCGTDDAWKADYYEAVWQDVTVVADDDGRPSIEGYSGCMGRYDDGSTDDEQIVCRNCHHEIPFGAFIMVPEGERVMSANDAVGILFGQDAEDADAPWRSGADIAASVASFFKLTPIDVERIFQQRREKIT